MNNPHATAFSPRIRGPLLALALAFGASSLSAQSFNQPDTDFQGSVRSTSNLVLPGTEIELAGAGFKPGQKITLLRGPSVLNAQPYVADAEGKFSAKLAIPADAVAGIHPIVVQASGPDAASILELKISKQLPVTGQDRFDVTSKKLTQGLYQVAYSAGSNALFVTSAVGRPPVQQSELLKVNPKTLAIVARVTPQAAPAPTPRPGQEAREGGVYAVYGVAVDDANGTVWVTNTRQNSVAVYRQSNLELVKQFPAGAVPHARDVIVDSTRGRAYASATGETFISVFDAKTLEQLPNIEIPSSIRGKTFTPASLELDAKTGKLYTVGLSTGEAAVIDGATGKVEKVFALPNARSAIGVAWNPVAKRLLVASQGSDNLLIVDPETAEVVHDVYVGAGALNVAYEPVSGLAFVSNRVAGTLTAVDADGNVVGNFSGGSFPNHVHEDGKGAMYAINKARGTDDPEGDRITRIVPKKKR